VTALGAAALATIAAVVLWGARQTPSRTAADESLPAAPSAAEAATPEATAATPEAAVATRPPLSDPPDPGPAPDSHGLSAAELAAGVASSVRISGMACNIATEASGFAVHEADLVATSAHVVAGLSEPTVHLADGRKLNGQLVAIDTVSDLAVLRVAGAGLDPLPLRAAAPDGALGAVLGWENDRSSGAAPAPSPFRIDRPVTVRTEIVGGSERVERLSWLLAARIESGHSGAALLTAASGRAAVVGVAWGASRNPDADVGYATRASELEELLTEADLSTPADQPGCR